MKLNFEKLKFYKAGGTFGPFDRPKKIAVLIMEE
jgi:hypothetical protein